MTEVVEKYLWDVKITIQDLNSFIHECNSYNEFKSDKRLLMAVERFFEKVGEILIRIRKEDSNVVITDMNKIIGLRNLIAHEYDRVDAAQLWTIIQNYVPKLNEEVQELINKFPKIN